RVLPFRSVGTFPAESDISDLPVDLSFGANFGAGHAMPAETDVDAVTMGDRNLLVHEAVAVSIVHAPHVGSDTDKEISMVCENSARDIGDFGIKVFQYQLRKISKAVSIPVFNAIDVFLLDGHIPPVAR